MRRCPRLIGHSRLRLSRRSVSTATTSRIADVLSKDASANEPKDVTINGFVRSVRKQKKVAFASIGDGTSYEPLQAVLRPDQADRLSTGAAVRLSGQYRPSLANKEQASELHVNEVEVHEAHDAASYPLQKKYHSPEYLRTIPHLRVRSPLNALLLRMRSQMIAQATRYFEEAGYFQTQTPIITSSDCEGAGEVFKVNCNEKMPSEPSAEQEASFFGSPKYLTVSSQLHLEALAQSVGHVWTLSPTFRAEQSDTARHLSEFYMLEAEACFVEDLSEIMMLVEALVRSLAANLAESKLGRELLDATVSNQTDGRPSIDLVARWKGLLKPSWPRITYKEAVDVLRHASETKQASFVDSVDDSSGLSTEHEKWIADTVGKGGPVFVTDYPTAIKPFYMTPSKEAENAASPVPTVACFDLLMPDVCEVAGGSMREHRLSYLEAAMKAKGLFGSTEDGNNALDWYVDLRRFGSAPHGGFGLGFDRLLSYLAGVHNIRDMVTFPRWHGRCVC